MKVFKVLLVGDGGVGKSTLLDAYKLRKFFDHEITIGLSLSVCTVSLGPGERYKFNIYDFSGQPRFFKMIKIVPHLMRGAHGAMLVFDLSSLPTLLTVEEWASIIKKVNGDIPMVLVGAKADLEREVKENDVRDLMERLGINAYVETSAKLLKNVDEPFRLLAHMIAERVGTR